MAGTAKLHQIDCRATDQPSLHWFTIEFVSHCVHITQHEYVVIQPQTAIRWPPDGRTRENHVSVRIRLVTNLQADGPPIHTLQITRSCLVTCSNDITSWMALSCTERNVFARFVRSTANCLTRCFPVPLCLLTAFVNADEKENSGRRRRRSNLL